MNKGEYIWIACSCGDDNCGNVEYAVTLPWFDEIVEPEPEEVYNE